MQNIHKPQDKHAPLVEKQNVQKYGENTITRPLL